MIKSVYIHIPFCRNICSYCNFCKFYYNEDMVLKYLEALEREVKEKYMGDVVSTIYVGGGSPSDLSVKEIKYLMKIISGIKKADDYEFTFECNFDIDEERLLLLKESGVNRLSFGIETVSDKYLNILKRKLDKESIQKKVKFIRDIGINNINGDLMYAFKDETLPELKKDIDFILSLNLEHISTYSLIIEEHTMLYLDKFTNCTEDVDSKMYYYIHEELLKHGYLHYEVSNYSKEGYQSRHNMTYWNNLEYYGFGISASGYVKSTRYDNTKSFNKYINNNYTSYFENLDIYDKMSYEMILFLRTSMGVNVDKFYETYHKYPDDVFKYEDLIEEGYLKKKGNMLYIPYDKWYVMNSILIRFVR